jgi:hypothetical protein
MGLMNDDMKELARQLSPLAEISLDETGGRANWGQYDVRLSDRREERGDSARDTAEHRCESLRSWKLPMGSGGLCLVLGLMRTARSQRHCRLASGVWE